MVYVHIYSADYKEDPYSEGDSCNAICCRGDLRGKDPGPFGCYDTKVISIFKCNSVSVILFAIT